eukprot:CAMPEP_0183740466 /NCGR_PEP_ID=MMETSP0737-20130205/59700_1 /TAXON_ID=385413 /ORGANISM="Thalassiosira miniscula, Strain CCMP1093" /LENGTH=53 /DNA_ID=CAMNT_0025975537 /DNA_START=42 /DNA_END=203 /DNA_ORIENTATION=-
MTDKDTVHRHGIAIYSFCLDQRCPLKQRQNHGRILFLHLRGKAAAMTADGTSI